MIRSRLLVYTFRLHALISQKIAQEVPCWISRWAGAAGLRLTGTHVNIRHRGRYLADSPYPVFVLIPLIHPEFLQLFLGHRDHGRHREVLKDGKREGRHRCSFDLPSDLDFCDGWGNII
jgi:hypothetical protein